MKTILLIITSFYLSNAHATFQRFWIGYKKSELTTSSFVNDLNKIFFGKTVDVGRGKGLIAYQPYISKMNSKLPDEIALVTYQDEQAYSAIKATEAGHAYSELHWDYFQKLNSKSTVPAPFTGTLQSDAAFELNPNFENWQSGETHLIIYQLQLGQLPFVANAFANLKLDRRINDTVLLVTGNIVIEYRSYRGRQVNPQYLPMRIIESAVLNNLYVDQKQIGIGSGINFQF